MKVRCPKDDEGIKLLRKSIKAGLPVIRGDATTMCIVPFGPSQTKTHMLGYIQKSSHQHTYEVREPSANIYLREPGPNLSHFFDACRS